MKVNVIVDTPGQSRVGCAVHTNYFLAALGLGVRIKSV